MLSDRKKFDFNDKFAQDDLYNHNSFGSFVMKADAMPRRFEKQDLFVKDQDICRGSYGNREWYQEQVMLNMAHSLLDKGVTKPKDIPLEDWINQHMEIIHNEDRPIS